MAPNTSAPAESQNDHHTGAWQFDRALGLAEEYAQTVNDDATDPRNIRWGADALTEAQLHATLAAGAFVRDLVAVLGTVAQQLSRVIALSDTEGESR